MRKVFSLLLVLLIVTGCKQHTASGNQESSATKAQQSTDTTKTILFFGDSLTAGYGLDDPSEAFPGVIQSKIDSAKLPYNVVNAGVSGETTAGGKGRIDWVLKQKITIFILELGANDGLRGLPVEETADNLQVIIDRVKEKYPEAKLVLAGMQIPPNIGTDYANKFKSIFPKIAAKNKMTLIPFLLQGVGGVPALNQKDGIHPTAAGARIVAANVWKVLKPLL